jgi:hypothetical protein
MSVMPPQMPSPPGGAPGAPPMGTSPTTQPVPNRGSEVMAKQGLAMVLKLMGELIQKFGATSEEGMAVAKAIAMLSKFTQPGASNPMQQQQQLKELAMHQQQMSQMPQPKPGEM